MRVVYLEDLLLIWPHVIPDAVDLVQRTQGV